MQSICPTDDELRAFAVGDVTEPFFERLAEHVAACPRCDRFLETLDAYADCFVDGLKRLNNCERATDVFVPEEVVAGAKSALCRSSVSSDIAFDPGRHYARKLADGPCRMGRFELQAELGDGSFGYVFRARDLELDRTVAVKIQRAGRFASDEEIRRFLYEARSAAQLQHSGIVSLYDSGQTEDGICFLVTEYVEGETLEARLRKAGFAAAGKNGDSKSSGPFSFDQASKLVAELAETLQYAHEHGVVHRDMKPANVLLAGVRNQESGVSRTAKNPTLTPDSRFMTPIPKITDFGLAKRLAGERAVTTDGRIMGTPAYMSPEQARGDSHSVDARSDVYSLGVILYELLTGERPFHGNRRLLLLQVLEDEPRAPRRLNSQIPKDLETICLKAMAKSPPRRYQTAQQLADDLRRFGRGESIAARPTGFAERLWRWGRRHPLAAGLLLALTLGPTIGFWYLSYLSTYFVEETALDSARLETYMLERIHEFYSKEVVGRLKPKTVRVGPDYAERGDTIPLPATFLLDVGEYISRGESGMGVRLYSGYPWRSDGGPKDDFQKKAFRELQKKALDGDDELTFHDFATKDGRHVVRFAKGLIMQKSCLSCHKGKDSPKRDWKVGELVGVLEVTRPLDRDIERTRTGLGGAFVLVGSIGVLLVGASLTLAVVTRLRRRMTNG